MPEVTKRICLDVAKNNRAETIFAKQHDYNSRFITATICNNGERIVVQPSAQVVFNVRREDDSAKAFLGTVNANGTVTVPLTSWALELGGIISCSISVVENEQKLTTTSFAINIEDVEYSGEDIAEDEGKDLIVELIAASDKANAAAQSAVEAATVASNAAEKADTAAQNAVEAAMAASSAVEKASTAAQNAEKATTAANSAAEKADISAQSADEAATAANNAAEGAEKVNISAEETPTGANITVTDRAGTTKTVNINIINAVSTWADIRNVVADGRGATLFPVGYEFTTFDADTGKLIIWVVRGHDHHKPANGWMIHSMTLEAKYLYSGANGSQKAVQFDAQEALYYAENGLAAGVYNFSLSRDDITNGGGKTFSFTLTQPIPTGGVIMFPWAHNTQSTATKISTYASNAATEVIETVSVIEGANGINLGTADGTTENMNHTNRARYGSNNYAQSAVRQWLNSSAVAGAVWSPTNKFDRPPSWLTTHNGFMHGLPADFLKVVEPAIIPCCTNSKFETDSFDGTKFVAKQTYNLSDKFFLLSRPEIYGTWDDESYKDGGLLDYYDGLPDIERTKYDSNGASHYAFIRTPYRGAAQTIRLVLGNGSLNGNYPSSNFCVAPACIIA